MLEKLKDKYVFFDVDGTLSEYRTTIYCTVENVQSQGASH